jgi:hypothetical protein
MLLAQRLNMGAGQVPRRSLPVARALPVELELGPGKVSAVTLDVSAGGFLHKGSLRVGFMFEQTSAPDRDASSW